MFDFPNSPSVGQVYQPAGGPSWAWDGTVWKSYQSAGETALARTFIPGASAAAVTYDYTKPANLRHLEFEGVAAGGSAGPAIATGASVWSFSSGGGGGAWGRKLFTAAALPTTVTITIGRPGQGVSSGGGQTANQTTFGSLITLPGGLGGLQGANFAYSSYGTISGSSYTSYPSGVDVGSPGETSDGAGCLGPNTGYVTIGRAGGSPWGKGIYGLCTSALNSIAAVGYGAGSGGTLNAGSSALRSSVAGGPGAVLLTEYLAVAPSDVARPLEQTFSWAGSPTLDIAVPTGAKLAHIEGTVWTASGLPYLYMRVSGDGTNFYSGASDYGASGPSHWSGSTGYTALPAAQQALWYISTAHDHTVIPQSFTIDLNVARVGGAAAAYNMKSNCRTFYSVAAYQNGLFWLGGYLNVGGMPDQLKALRLGLSGPTNAASGTVTVQWSY